MDADPTLGTIDSSYRVLGLIPREAITRRRK